MHLYAYNSKKRNRVIHIVNPITKTTYCDTDNRFLDTIGDNPGDRPPCKTCQNNLIKSKVRKKPKGNRGNRRRRTKDKIKAREALIKHFKLHKFATNIGICLCIHNECGAEIPSTDKNTNMMMIDYWKNLSGRNHHNKYNYMSSDEFYSSKKWRELRFVALQQSNGRCTLCGASAKDGVQIHVDHIKPRSKYPKLQFDLDNLQILCQDCNLGKSNYDETDFR